MTLSSILKSHSEFSPPGFLCDNLGDGYLLAHNSIYQKIRTLTIEAGYRFSNKPDNRYLALALSQLEQIHKTKEIPYIDNVSVLKEIEKKIPGTTTWDEIFDSLRVNYIFHESCHATARSQFLKIKSELSNEQHATRLLLEESFANACELLAVVDANPTVHRYFFEMNSYSFMFDSISLIKNLQSSCGHEFVFAFMWMCYFHSNNLLDELTHENLQACIDFVENELEIKSDLKISQKLQKDLRKLGKLAFMLNPRFREITTGFYLRLYNLKLTIAPNEKRSLCDLLSKQKIWNQRLRELISHFRF